MVLYTTKADFLARGLSNINPSPYNISHDCIICNCPLHMTPSSPPSTSHTTTATTPTLHPAVRITSCAHIHGRACLLAWLETGHTCPTCARMLFPPVHEQPLTQQDVNHVVDELGVARGYGEERVMAAVAQYIMRSEREGERRRQIVESVVALESVREEERRMAEEREVALVVEDWGDSEGKEEEEEDFWGDGEEDGGIVV
ncbi:hypothetical protein BU26DRAFT_565399 [Trematosphaeria pertusa]|uniref:RING-type domain-containing protein n=1 Tax=Trematosphaeria pertusa TaxID=390896 RepID=A0A6A6ID39_9PLEO|nr:uncharacterized protein BU26DRAFT_565399 [Trematosphaeria pertusa]KAF2247978.1 hypothetical protein BU26DRAFT_565399 [Trematosphaeria pertusa]